MTDYLIIFHFAVGMPDLEFPYSCANDDYAMTQAERYVKALDSSTLKYATVWAAGDENTEPRHVATVELRRVVSVSTPKSQ